VSGTPILAATGGCAGIGGDVGCSTCALPLPLPVVAALSLPASSMTMSTWPTAQIFPSGIMIRATLPPRGAGISTVALSVMISTIGWSSWMVSPSFTFHFTTSPSTTPSPMSGSLNSKAMATTPGCVAARRRCGRHWAGIRARACTGTACRAATRRMGRLEVLQPRSWIVATSSPPKPHVLGASCAMTQRPVFVTDAMIASMS
jgi:hypothetical protein